MAPSQLDLRELAIDRSKDATAKPVRKPWMTRYGIPGIILLGFATLLTLAAGEQFLPRRPVTVVPVIMARADVQKAGKPLFQAAGWVEPRPTPVLVSALTEGVVEQLFVVEGQQVLAGDPVAKLLDVDARQARHQAEIAVRLREAELQSAQAQLEAAQLRLKHPVHLQAMLADAQSLLAQTNAQIAQLPFLIETARADVEYALLNLEGKQSAKDAIAARLIQQANTEWAAAKTKLRELEHRKPLLENQANALQKKVDALSTQLQLLIEENRQLKEAMAGVRVQEAKLAQARIDLEKTELNLERTFVRAPINGRVLSIVAHPGTRVMGLESLTGQSSGTVISMYDPRMLQVRADVRLEDVPMVQPGQPVEIVTALSKEPIAGTVLMPTSSANIQKNTLEVKVAITDPPSSIRPEMLVTVTFLAPEQQASPDQESQESERMLVPRQLVQTTQDGSRVWIVDSTGRARLQPVVLGNSESGSFVEVVEGVQPTDKLISSDVQGLQTGTRVVITGEDPTLGMEMTNEDAQ